MPYATQQEWPGHYSTFSYNLTEAIMKSAKGMLEIMQMTEQREMEACRSLKENKEIKGRLLASDSEWAVWWGPSKKRESQVSGRSSGVQCFMWAQVIGSSTCSRRSSLSRTVGNRIAWGKLAFQPKYRSWKANSEIMRASARVIFDVWITDLLHVRRDSDT